MKISKTPEYISPSSFKEWIACQYKFYKRRMENLTPPSNIQGGPAAVGCAFDAYLTRAIAVNKGLGDDPQYDLDKLLKDSIHEYNLELATQHGRELFVVYVNLGCFDELLKEDITVVHPGHRTLLTVNGKDLPVLGYPDAVISDGTPLDYKVNGALSKTGQSPKPGYYRSICLSNKIKVHPDKDKYLEEIDYDWALQLTIYNWQMSGVYPWRELKARIEQVAIRGNNIVVASFNNKISIPFQQQLFEDLHNAWGKINKGEIEIPKPSKMKCMAFNQLCEFASDCAEYQKIINNPALKDIFF